MPVSPADSAAAATGPELLPPPAPLLGFSAEEYQVRRSALRSACPNGIILLRGSTEDEVVNPARYRQNSTFLYFTGVETPGASLVLLPSDLSAEIGVRGATSDTREVLFLPARNASVETWTGPKLGPGEDTENATGIQKTADAAQRNGALLSWIRHNPVVYTPAPFGENARFSREYALIQHLQTIAAVVQVKDATVAIGRLRMVKSPAEVAKIVEAITVTQAGQRAARNLILSGAGRREYEAEAAALQAFRSAGASLAFGCIVGGGANATVLHYEDNNCTLQQGDLVVVDIGAKVDGYCGDLTRAYPVGGKFGTREREIYNLVLEAHKQTVSGYKPGETLQDLTDRCKAFYRESPIRARNAAGEEQTMDNFMPHSLSHHLGLDVHDVGDRETALAPGHVITVEPGIYIPSEKIGVRIEDDYLITEEGMALLGPPLEWEIEELEALSK